MSNTGGTTSSHTVLLYVNVNVEDSYTARISPGSTENVVFTEPVSSRHLCGIAGRPARTVHCGGYTAGKSPGELNTARIIAIIAVGIIVAFVTRARRRQG